MGKTKLLRKLVMEQLQAVPGGTYHRLAPNNAPFPYKVFQLERATFTDARDDIYLEVDVWDKSMDPKQAEDIVDQVEDLLNDVNLPAPPIYPTFFREARYALDDPDKTLQHIQLRFLVQLYEEE